MNKLLIFTLLALNACDSTPPKSAVTTTRVSGESQLLSSISPSSSQKFAFGATVIIDYKAIGNLDSVQFFVNNIKLSANKFVPTSVGTHNYRVVAYHAKEQQSLNGQFTVLAAKSPEICRIKILKKHPHDPRAYTQGLLFHGGKFIESTGERGRSSIREVAITSGNVLQKRDLDAKFFGEGVALLGSKLFQLTWQEGVVFVYDRANFDNRTELPLSGEGWGVTTDGTKLYISDGSHRISVYDAPKFQRISTIQVADNKQIVNYINELEWINGKIWANVYTTNYVVVIDPHTGIIEKFIDCSDLANQIGNASSADVLNGIAHDPATGRIWMTGKDWDTLFEVSL